MIENTDRTSYNKKRVRMDTEVLYEAETDTCTTAGYVADRKDRADGTDGRNAL